MPAPFLPAIGGSFAFFANGFLLALAWLWSPIERQYSRIVGRFESGSNSLSD